MVWTALQRYSTMLIQFISGIILARLLSPYDYGCIGMLTIFMVLAEAFIDGGFGSALIQKKNPTQEDYSTIFFWNLGMAAVMYAILYFCAPVISRFYKIPLLCPVLRVQALVLFIYAFNIIQKNQLRKKLNFKILSIITIVTSIVALVVTIIMAHQGLGVWALVAQNLLTAAIPALAFWFYVKWRPILVFSWESFKELFGFGFYMFLTHLVERFSTQVTGLIIGRVYNASTLGYYSKALSTERLASHSISNIMTQVTYPLYAEIQDDKARMCVMIKRLTTTLAYITFPMMFILLLVAEPVYILLYTEKWLPAVPYFQVLCISGLAACLQSVNLQTISAIGRSNTMFIWTMIKRTAGLIFMVGGLLVFGMNGLLWGVVLNAWFSYMVNISLVSKYIGYSWSRQLMDILPVALAASFATVISYFGTKFLNLSLYPDAIVKFLIYCAVYLGWSFICKPESFTYALSIIPAKFRFWDKNKKKK